MSGVIGMKYPSRQRKKGGPAIRPPSAPRQRDVRGAASFRGAPDFSALEAAAVAVVALDAQALLEPVHLELQAGELAAAETAARSDREPGADLVRFAAQAERLALRGHPAPGRALAAHVDPVGP